MKHSFTSLGQFMPSAKKQTKMSKKNKNIEFNLHKLDWKEQDKKAKPKKTK